MRASPLTTLSYSLMAVLGVLPVLALADSESETVSDLGELTVTANQLYYIDTSADNEFYKANIASVGTKIPEHLSNIPQSVSVITQKKLDDLNVATLDELAKRTTGLRVLQNDAGRSSIYARGYEYDQYSIDGLSAPMASIYGNLPNLIPFDRVEVMRGPSGLFNSSSEMGGVVNLVRKRGNLYDKNSLSASVSNQGYEVSGDVLGALGSDRVLGRAIVSYQSDKPKSIDKLGLDANENSTAYLSVDKYFDDEQKNRLGLGYLYQARQITPNNGLPTYSNLALLPLPDQRFYGAKWNAFENKSHDVFVDGRYQLSNQGLLSGGLRYSKRDGDFNYVYAGNTGLNPSTGLMSATGTAAVNDESSLSADINLSQPFLSGGFQQEFVIGADYKRQKQDTVRANAANLGANLTIDALNNLDYTDIVARTQARANGFRFVANHASTMDEKALYGKLRYRVAKPLTFVLGGRLSQYDITSTNKATGLSAHYKDSATFTGYGAATYQLRPNMNAYVSYTQVFTPQGETGADGNLLKPREGNQWELGLKARHNDLASRISIYQLDDKNVAASTANNERVALGKRRMRGAELEFSGYLTDKLELAGGYSYLDSTIKTAGAGDAIFLLMPKHSANLWLNYEWQTALSNPITLGLGVNYVGKFSSSAGIHAPSAHSWDMMASYPISDKLKAQLNVYNLFGKEYYARVGSRATFNIPANDRLIKASLTYQF